MNFNSNIEKLNQSGTIALFDKIKQLRKTGKNIIGLHVGDPNFNTPIQIIHAAEKALADGLTHYSSSRGLPELREAIASAINMESPEKYSADENILVTHGAVHAYYIALQAILNPGDQVVVPDPTWMTHANLVQLLGAKAVRVASQVDNNLFPAIEDLEKSITNRTKAIVINSPCNPTGTIASTGYLKEIANLADKHNLYIISDEVYNKIIYRGFKNTSFSTFDGIKKRLLLLQSFSKTYAMTGWRVGYLAAPAEVIEQALKASQYSITHVSPFVQRGALAALNDNDVKEQVAKMVFEYQLRRDLAVNLFNNGKQQFDFIEPQGAFYLFLNIKKSRLNSVRSSEELLAKYNVAVVPGSVYGNNGEGYVRISLASSKEEIELGIEKIKLWMESFN